MSRSLSLAIVSCAALSLAPASNAAPISWSIVDVTGGSGIGDAAVSTNGTTIEAANFAGSGGAPDVVINGITFVGIDFLNAGNPTNLVGLNYNNSQNGNGETFGTDSINLMLDTIGFRSQQNVTDADISGLTPGLQYEVQFFLSHTNTASRTQEISDGEGNTIIMKNANPSQAVTGTFTADAAIQFVQFDNLSSGSQLLSGYQLRLVPEPSSLALLGLGGLLISRRRRSDVK
jgi:hypothetical protein